MWWRRMFGMLAVGGLILAALLRPDACHQTRTPGSGDLGCSTSEIVFPRRLDGGGRRPYPSYAFRGFKRTFVLLLRPAEGLLAPSYAPADSRECFFSGTLAADSTSSVSLSTCNGLWGVIRACHGDYWIEARASGAHHLCLTSKGDPTRCTHRALVAESRSRRSVSQEWNLEVLVVADSKMKQYHSRNLEMYILTLMSSVALIYKDSSIGNNINLSVAKLVVMSENEDVGIIFPSATKTLRNFCKWQQDVAGSHHDVAILLTREDLCRMSKTCDTLGLAQSGMVCDSQSSCAVIEDNGLSASFTIAHEIGHILGVPHDDDKKCDRFQKEGHGLHVMARMLDYNSHPWTWSDCSRHFITAFLDAGHAHCLLSKSNENDLLTRFEHSGDPPGALYDMDYQCELVFGKGSKICPYMPVCKRLWCTMEDVTQGGCRTQHMPWADGTRCGHNKSCLHGECVLDPVYFLPPQNGQWGEWQSFGPCSRSCGGGIKRSVRECDSPRPKNGGRYCVGDRTRYKSCEMQECPLGGKDFREEQCSAFNGKTFSFPGIRENVKWVPHYSGIDAMDRCKLYCRASGTAAYFLLKEKVIDGTTCGPETYDMCINGKCVPAGCDHILHSNRAIDSCGLCGGNGTSCRVVHGRFAEARYGYNNVVTVPAGASNIEVLQHGFENTKDDNYLALKSADDSYILNGEFMISMFPKIVHYAGTHLEYTGSDAVVERINATKRLQKDLYVQVLTVGSLRPPAISFQYTISKNDKILYSWRLEEDWSSCSRLCQGEQHRMAKCFDKANGQAVSDDKCHNRERPPRQAKVCNLSCTLKWLANETTCVQQMNSGVSQVVGDSYCAHLQPSRREDCDGSCSGKLWKYGEWSQCTTSCGRGTQSRTAVCIDENGRELPEIACDGGAKVAEQECNTKECPQWRVGNWKQCTSSCGYGVRRRSFWCEHEGQVAADSLCPLSAIPANIEQCILPPCASWKTGPWEPCSVSCGSGTRKRSVMCAAYDELVDATHCDRVMRPIEEVQCVLPRCSTAIPAAPKQNASDSPQASTPSWRTGNWSSCSASCGEGSIHRQVLCYQEASERVMPERKCNRSSRPDDTRECRLPPCGRWITGKWSECSAKCGGEGVQTRRIVCRLGDGHQAAVESLCGTRGRPKDVKNCKAPQCPSVPLLPLPNSVENEYNWRTGLWGKCSKSCGGGLRKRQVACYDEGGKRGHHCNRDEKPLDTSLCNTEKCPEWIIGEWNLCSVTCGKGVQKRTVRCVNHKGLLISHSRCGLPHPETEKICKRSRCIGWSWSEWSECTSSCGKGTQMRFSRCRRRWKDLDEQACASLPKPTPETRSCRRSSCTFHWKKRKWSKCSSHCGKGYKFREVVCVSGSNAVVEDSFCKQMRKPKVKRKCYQYRCQMTWNVGHWSDCSASCGRGVQQRSVTCHRVNSYHWINPEPILAPTQGSETWCGLAEKPATTRGCTLGECSRNVWRTSPWLPCSVKCGTGRQRRRIRCYSAMGKRLLDNQCDEKLRPQRRRKCFPRPCAVTSCGDLKDREGIFRDGEQELFVRGRYVKIYCARMNSSIPQEYITLIRGEQDNYSEVYNKRLANPETCPYRGVRYDACDCTTDDSAAPGLTTYQRIAVNLTSLLVITQDTTFSQTHGLHSVPFGESGDCYSMASCPQGRFSLSLLGTGFVVSPLTKWVTEGNFSSSRIRWLEGGRVIQGKCGGYCGRCAPDTNTGLLLEVAPP